MTKADLHNLLQERLGGLSKKQAAELLEEILTLIKQTLAGGEDVKISGFGSFVVRDKEARTGRNPPATKMYARAR
jgi:integration host factor subunit alpha